MNCENAVGRLSGLCDADCVEGKIAHQPGRCESYLMTGVQLFLLKDLQQESGQ